MPAAGKSESVGILFPKDPGGGGGDAAWIRYYQRSGEATTFEIGTSNDKNDHIALMPSGNVGIGISKPEAKLHVIGDFLGAAKGSDGKAFKIVVGNTVPGKTKWVKYSDHGIYVDIDTSSARFTSTPLYFTSLGGKARHWTVMGPTSIYVPTAKKFRVYLYKHGVTVKEANSYNWHITWIGIGK